MTVIYLVRSPGTGHSIEELFGDVANAIEKQGIQARLVRLPHVSRGLRSVWQNLRFVRGLQADVFHITGDVHYAALALPASKTVLTIHDCGPLERTKNRPLRYLIFWFFWYYWPICRAAVVTTVSEKTRQELIRQVGRVAQKTVVIANGYAPDFWPQPAVFRKDHPVLLQVGTAPNKNLLRLIAALEGITCTLVLIGPLTEAIRRALQAGQIHYRNYVNLSRAEVIGLYETCDIVTFLSTYEGFGMPILEANAVGRVIITSTAVPMANIIPDAVHLVNPTDITAIREGVLRLIHDYTYRQMLIEIGRTKVQNYTVAATANRYRELYERVVKQPELAGLAS